MPARILSFPNISAPSEGEYSLISCALPGRSEQTIGVMLLDGAADTLHVRIRRDWEKIADEEDAEVLAELEEDLNLQATQDGGKVVFDRLLNTASISLRVSDRESLAVGDFDRTLNDLYRRHVRAEVLRFRTHLPRYPLAVAAGPFLTNREGIEAEEWVETPPDLKLDGDMFIAKIQGHSMEPRIPDGSLCVFRKGVVGSRRGRLVLVRNNELADENRYTVKRYQSAKLETEDGFLQTRIWLESLNPAYPSWDLDEDSDKYEVTAEFVRVLE